MAEDKLSAREAALVAQARAELAQKAPAAPPQLAEARPAPAAPADVAPASPTHAAPGAAPSGAPAANADPAQRLAALMATARAESERLRERQRKLYLWTPLAFLSVLGLWALLWMWHRL